MGGQLFPGKRLNGFFAPPEFFTIIGDDTDDGPEHPLYDPRCKLPEDDALIALAKDIAANGYLEPIKVRKNGEAAEVIFGRRRVRAGRIVNRWFKEQGKEPIEVPFTVGKYKDDGDMLGVSISENEHRKGDDVITKAEKAFRLSEYGQTDEKIAARFGVKPGTVRLWISLLDTSAKVRKAISSGKISATAAGKLVKLSRSDQDEALAKMIAEGRTTVRDAGAAASGRSSSPKPKKPAAGLLRKLADHNFVSGDIEATLRWVTGESDDPPKDIADALANIEEGG